jgi:hypothetical protein
VNAKSSLCWTLIGCCGLVAIFTTGCSHWIELMAPPGNTQEQRSQTIARDEQVPLVLDRVRFTRNGSPQNPSLETERRLLGSLGDIGLFSRLSGTAFSEPQANEKVFRARLVFDEAIDPHPGDAAWKGIVIGASMFVLTPFIPLEYDYAARVTLDLERWDGQIKHYESRSAGTIRYHLFGATPIMIDELKGHVTESCLTDLAQQLVQDTTFYYASSAPITEPGIRTVTVKSRTFDPSVTPSPVVIPVSAPPEP